MIRSLVIALMLGKLVCSPAHAVQINVVENSADNYSIYYEDTFGYFDGAGLYLRPDPGFKFLSPDDGLHGVVPRLPGDSYSFVNYFLDVAVEQGGYRWTIPSRIVSNDGITLEGGVLGGTIKTPNAPGLFLANVLLPPGGTATYEIHLVSSNQVSLHGVIGIPEPSCVTLVNACLLGCMVGGRSHTRRFR